jgi:Fe-S oxidoreductase
MGCGLCEESCECGVRVGEFLEREIVETYWPW